MIKPRQAFGLCAVNNFIYVAGGASVGEYEKTTERYDVLNDSWEILKSCKLPMRMFAQSFITFKKRFIYAFGYSSGDGHKMNKLKLGGSDKELILKLDTFFLDKGWQILILKSKDVPDGCQYGVLPLSNFSDWRGNSKSEMIIFGGLNMHSEPQKMTRLVAIDHNNFEKTQLLELQDKQSFKEQLSVSHKESQVEETKDEKVETKVVKQACEELQHKDRFYFA